MWVERFWELRAEQIGHTNLVGNGPMCLAVNNVIAKVCVAYHERGLLEIASKKMYSFE